MMWNLFEFGEIEGYHRCTSLPAHMGQLPARPETKHSPMLTSGSTAPAADHMPQGGTHRACL